MKAIKSSSEVPLDRHYAVIVYKSIEVYHSGDPEENNKPGWDYRPGYTETIERASHYVFMTMEDLIGFVSGIEKGGDRYVILEVLRKLSAKTKIEVSIE